MQMRVIWKSAAARRRELGGERSLRRNGWHDLVADAAEVRHTVGETFDLEPMPVHAARLIHVVLHQNAHGLAALELQHWTRKLDGIWRGRCAVALQHKAVRGPAPRQAIRTLLYEKVNEPSLGDS